MSSKISTHFHAIAASHKPRGAHEAVSTARAAHDIDEDSKPFQSWLHSRLEYFARAAAASVAIKFLQKECLHTEGQNLIIKKTK